MRIALSLYHSLLLFDDQGQGIWSSLIPLSQRSLSLCLRTQAKRTAQKDINTGTSKAGSPIFCGTSQKDFRSAEIYVLFYSHVSSSDLNTPADNVKCQMCQKQKSCEVLTSNKCKHSDRMFTGIITQIQKHKNCTKQKYVFTSNKCRLCCCYAYSVSHTDWSHEPPSFLLIAYLTCLTRRNIMVFRRHHRCVQIFLRQLKLSSILAKTVQIHEIRIHFWLISWVQLKVCPNRVYTSQVINMKMVCTHIS